MNYNLIIALCKTVIESDFKSVKKKFLDQGLEEGLVKKYLGSFKELRDGHRIKDASEKNIDFWGKKPFKEFSDFIDKLLETSSKTQIKKDPTKAKKVPGAEIKGENEDWIIYKILNYKASELLGSREWCIVRDEDNWISHNVEMNFYYFLSKTRDKEDYWYKIALGVDKEGKELYWNYFNEPSNGSSTIPEEELDLPEFEVDEFLLTEDMQLEAVKHDAYVIRDIENPSEEVLLEAVKHDAYVIRYIENPSEEMQLAAVKQEGLAIEYIENPSEAVQLEAVEEDGSALRYIKDPTEYVQLAVIDKDGLAIQFIEDPSEEIQLAAVYEDGRAIEYIEDPSEEVQLEAIRQYNGAIQLIKFPSEEVQLEAVKENGEVIQFIEDPSEEVQLAAVKQNGFAIQHIEDPSEEVQLAAVKQDGFAIKYIKDPTKKVLDYLAEREE